MKAKVSVLFVCLGNICRSPTAEGVFRSRIHQLGLSEYFEVDSAGTSAYHIGSAPDGRSTHAALQRGYDLSAQSARQVLVEDFSRFHYVLAMDCDNLSNLMSIKPDDCSSDVALFLAYADNFNEQDVPDPYYGEGQGFERVLNLIEDASDGLLKSIRARYEF